MNLTLTGMASLGGVSRGSQILYEKGKPPTLDYLEALMDAGADGMYILTGQRRPLPGHQLGLFGPFRDLEGPIKHPVIDEWIKGSDTNPDIRADAAAIGRSGTPATASVSPGLHEGGSGDTLSIPWLEPRLGQGSAPIRLSLDWLQSVGLSIDTLRAVRPDEVQLPGCLGAAALALLEVPSRPSEEPESWAVYEGGRLVVALAQAIGAATLLLPADARGRARLYEATDISFRRLGRVVWLAVVRP